MNELADVWFAWMMLGMAPARPLGRRCRRRSPALARCLPRPRPIVFICIVLQLPYKPVVVNPCLRTPVKYPGCKSTLNVRPVDPDTPVVITSDGEQRPCTFPLCTGDRSYSPEILSEVPPQRPRKCWNQPRNAVSPILCLCSSSLCTEAPAITHHRNPGWAKSNRPCVCMFPGPTVQLPETY